jgi:hypothetical protein
MMMKLKSPIKCWKFFSLAEKPLAAEEGLLNGVGWLSGCLLVKRVCSLELVDYLVTCRNSGKNLVVHTFM